MTRHVLVLGGARSGKTAFAEQLAIRSGSRPAYLATAEALDSEMRDRVASHQAGRAGQFATIEEPMALSDALLKASAHHDVILVDCLTLWITNLLMANADVAQHVSELGAALVEIETAKIVLVTKALGLARFDLKYSAGTLPHDNMMTSIELYGTKVAPLVREELAR